MSVDREAALPQDTLAWQRLLITLLQQGLVDQASEKIPHALQACQTQADCHLLYHLAGTLACQRQNFPLAIDYFEQALARGNRQAETYYNLGLAYQRLNQSAQALEAMEQACRLKPKSPEIYTATAQLLQKHNQAERGLQLIAQAIAEFGPAFSLLFTQGLLYQQSGQPERAIQSYEQAKQLRRSATVFNNLGICHQEKSDYLAAIACFEEAIRLDNRCLSAYLNLSDLLQSGDRHPQALAIVHQGLQQLPNQPELLNQRIGIQRGCCDWTDLEELTQQLQPHLQHQLQTGEPCSIKPFQALSRDIDLATQLTIAKNQAKLNLAVSPVTLPRIKQTKLRIGYLSPHFRNHPTAQNIKGILQHHHREKFTVYAYALSSEDGSADRQQICEAVDHFVDVSNLATDDIVQRIRQDQIQILISLMGYTQHARLDILAKRAAPVQIGYQSYPGTLGCPGVWDYIIADKIVLPPAEKPYYAEQVLYLPRCYYAIDATIPSPNQLPLTRAEEGLPEQAFVYVSFSSYYKIEPRVFRLWMEILKQVPHSVLWLFGKLEIVRQNLRQAAKEQGVDPDRLIFATGKAKPYHLARHRLADFALDTLIYNAHTTAVDALKMGVPILTLPGCNWVTRVTASLLTDLDLPELIASDEKTYIKKAVSYAQSPAVLSELRQKLLHRLNATSLMDVKHLTACLEEAYEISLTSP